MAQLIETHYTERIELLSKLQDYLKQLSSIQEIELKEIILRNQRQRSLKHLSLTSTRHCSLIK